MINVYFMIVQYRTKKEKNSVLSFLIYSWKLLNTAMLNNVKENGNGKCKGFDSLVAILELETSFRFEIRNA